MQPVGVLETAKKTNPLKDLLEASGSQSGWTTSAATCSPAAN